MPHLLKNLLITAGALLLILHFTLVGKYLLKPDPISRWYAYPFFHQSWNLFVPPPENNYRLYVYAVSDTFHANNKSALQPITELFGEINKAHQQNRFSGKGTLLLALTNSIHYFEKGTAPNNIKRGKVHNDINFMILEKFVKKYLASQKKLPDQAIKIVLWIKSTQKDELRIYFS
jgi:hypothetical protein